jgi:phage protein D
MPINDPNAPAAARQPRLRVMINGKELPGAISYTVSSNNYYQSDTFTVNFALSAGAQAASQQTQDQQGATPKYDMNWWGDQTDILLDLQASMDAGDSWVSLILGQVDRLTADPVAKVISCEGRDLTARFIDAKTRETFQNKTSSQIAEELAGRHGMTADVKATDTPVGRYYGADHDRITLNSFSETTTEWDLLCYLAQNEGFDVWVTGTTLHFQPSTEPSADPYEVFIDMDTPQSNAIGMTLERSLVLAKDIVVAVRSWNSKQKHGFTVFNPNQLSSGRVAKGSAQEFSFVRPNLTGEQAQALANQIREDLSKKERLCTFHLPGDLILQPRNMLRLRGTNSSWDQAYYVDVVTRSMSLNGGFQMTARVKNHSPQTSVVRP